jgi:N-acetylneuraminate synthase
VSVFIIAEAGVNHNGDIDRALAMIDVAAEAGADAIKFQTFTAERLVSRSAPKAEYQVRETGDGGQFDMLKSLELSQQDYRRLFDRCGEAGIEFMSTPFDEGAADFLVDFGMVRLKVPSGEIDNHPLLSHLAAKRLPMIVSTGMATMDEVVAAATLIRGAWGALAPAGPMPLAFLHCTSNYPADPGDVNLLAIATMSETLDLPVGYSDHTPGLTVAIAATACGARIIEKHFTLDKSLPGPDHRASLEPAELRELVSAIRLTERALGSAVKAPVPSELAVRAVARRSVHAARDLRAGERIVRSDLVLLRPATGISPGRLEELVGARLTRDVEGGAPLQWDHVEA